MATKLPLEPRPVPLTELENGALRVTGTRIPLERIVEHYRAGRTPDQIVEAFDSLRLADVYTLIGFCLDHPQEVDDYLREQDRLAEEIRHKIELSQGPPKITREILLARKAHVDEAKRDVEAGR